MTLSDLLGPFVVNVIRDMEAVETQLSGIAQQFDLAEKLLPDPHLSQEDRKSAVTSILDASYAKLVAPSSTLDQNVAALSQKLKGIRGVAPWMSGEADSLLADVRNVSQRIVSQTKTLCERYDNLKSLVTTNLVSGE